MILKKIVALVVLFVIIFSLASCGEEDDGINPEAKEFNTKGTNFKREAISLMKQGNGDQAQVKLEEALDCYEKALKIQPDYTKALQNKNEVLKSLGRESEIK